MKNVNTVSKVKLINVEVIVEKIQAQFTKKFLKLVHKNVQIDEILVFI